MLVGDAAPCLVVGIQPMTNQRFNHQPRVAKVTGAIFLKLRPESGMKPVGPLLGFRLTDPF
jgi:hypothetical protein